MKIAVVPVLLSAPVILRSAWLISRACRPTWLSPISPSISARGTSAATESMTMRSSAPERTSMSAISSACSPVSGWETSRASVSTPSFFAYSGSSACSASMKAAMPPACCALATACRARVVLPRGLRAVDLDHAAARQPADAERDVERDGPGGDDLDRGSAASPRRITAPLPNCFSIWARARSRAFSRSPPLAAATGLGWITGPRGLTCHVTPSLPVRASSAPTGDQLSPSVSSRGLGQTLGGGTDNGHGAAVEPVDKSPSGTPPVDDHRRTPVRHHALSDDTPGGGVVESARALC